MPWVKIFTLGVELYGRQTQCLPLLVSIREQFFQTCLGNKKNCVAVPTHNFIADLWRIPGWLGNLGKSGLLLVMWWYFFFFTYAHGKIYRFFLKSATILKYVYIITIANFDSNKTRNEPGWKLNFSQKAIQSTSNSISASFAENFLSHWWLILIIFPTLQHKIIPIVLSFAK